MKIVVVGAGAMGSLFGGLLAESGHAVTLVDVNAAHLLAIRAEGLHWRQRRGPARRITAPCQPMHGLNLHPHPTITGLRLRQFSAAGTARG